MFAAMQAAQKYRTINGAGCVTFAAMQAAQKYNDPNRAQLKMFAAMQAAQKTWCIGDQNVVPAVVT